MNQGNICQTTGPCYRAVSIIRNDDTCLSCTDNDTPTSNLPQTVLTDRTRNPESPSPLSDLKTFRSPFTKSFVSVRYPQANAAKPASLAQPIASTLLRLNASHPSRRAVIQLHIKSNNSVRQPLTPRREAIMQYRILVDASPIRQRSTRAINDHMVRRKRRRVSGPICRLYGIVRGVSFVLRSCCNRNTRRDTRYWCQGSYVVGLVRTGKN